MQFTSNIIIVALLLAVSPSTVTAAPKSSNLRGGGSHLQEETAFSDPSSSGLSSSMHDVANPPLPNLDRSLVDNFGDSCPGLDSAADPTECPGWPSWGHLNPTCPKTQTLCWSMLSEDCYCHNN